MILILKSTYSHSFPEVESKGERPSPCLIAKSLRVNRKCNIITALIPGQCPLGRYCLVEVLLASHRTRCSEVVFLQVCLLLLGLQHGPKGFNTMTELCITSSPFWPFAGEAVLRSYLHFVTARHTGKCTPRCETHMPSSPLLNATSY